MLKSSVFFFTFFLELEVGLKSSIRIVLLFICPNLLTYFGALKFRAPISPCLYLHLYLYLCVFN